MSPRIALDRNQIAEFCQRHHIRKLSLYGSVLRDDFRPDSDVNVMVEFERGHEPDLMRLVRIQEELSEILGRKADLVEREAVENSENYIRRRHILQSLETVYVAR